MKVFKTFLTGLFVSITSLGFCAERPDVIRHDAQYLDHSIAIHVEWLSPNPVTKVSISAGSQAKEVTVDEYDNKRNAYGYQGEVSVNLPVDPQIFQQSVPYVIQLEDDLRQKSAPVIGKAPVQHALPPDIASHQHHDDDWGKNHLTVTNLQPPVGSTGPIAIIDKVVGLYDRIDSAPDLETIKVNILSPENVSFSTRANDDKALQEIRIKVYNEVGVLVGYKSLTGLGKVWQGTSQTFSLGGGSFRVIIQAVDNAGNTSAEQAATFQLSGRPKELQAAQETPPVTLPSPVAKTPSVPVSQQVDAPTPNTETLQPQIIPGL